MTSLHKDRRLTIAVTRWKTTIIFGIVGGALIGGLCAGITSLILWFVLVLIFGTVAIANVTTIATFSTAVGASLGAVTGLVAGSVARVAGDNTQNVLRYSTDWSLSSGVSAGVALTLSAWLDSIYAVGIAVVVAPSFFFFLKIKDAFTYMFKHRRALFLTVLARILVGLGLGYIFGFLSTGLVVLIVNSVAPLLATPNAVADLVSMVGPAVGSFSGGIVAINRSMRGSNILGVTFIAIEGSAVAGVAVAFGITLSWMGWNILGIGVATGATVLWNTTRGKGVEQSHSQGSATCPKKWQV